MAFALMAIKAHFIEKKQARLIDEKRDSCKLRGRLKSRFACRQKLDHCWVDSKNNAKNFLRRAFALRTNSLLYRTYIKLKTEGTYLNFLLKSIVGFTSGCFLTYMFFGFFVFTMNVGIFTSSFVCAIVGPVLTIGLAFSQRVRCVVLLVLPQFFSKRGRQALLAYGFILALTGPGKNTLNNLSIMSESMACGQEQLKEAVSKVVDVIKKPFLAAKEAMKKVVDVLKVIVKKIKTIFLAIKRVVMSIVGVIKTVFKFLHSVFNICSKKVGTPFQRCTGAFEAVLDDCYAKLGPMFSWLCSVAYLVKAVCYVVKFLDLLCMLLDVINDSIVGTIIKRIRKFVLRIKTMFYVRIKFSHQFDFESSRSKSYREIAADAVAHLKDRFKGVLRVFGVVNGVASLFFLIVVFNALLYRRKYLTDARFDNCFITREFRELDLRRAQMEKSTVLPLNHRERKRYTSITSFRLVKNEKFKLSKSFLLLLIVSCKMVSYMLTDYGLYWVLATIRFHGRFNKTVETPKVIGLHVDGNGFIADLYRGVVKAFQPIGLKMNIDSLPCLPDPIPPNLDKYIQIASILLICWVLTIFEPYGLRLRHHFMGYYHPARSRERTVWLYNQILRARGTFLKLARRRLRRRALGGPDAKVTLAEFVRAKLNYTCFKYFFKAKTQESCLLCGEVIRSDTSEPVRCANPGCIGVYCGPCFKDLENKCTVCLDPVQYGDLSDIDEEQDSSEDENSSKFKRRARRQQRKEQIKNESTEERQRGGEDFYASETDNSTEYSFSYQYKDPEERNDEKTPFRDVEKQEIPDYASVSTFARKPSGSDTDYDSDVFDSRKSNGNRYRSDRLKLYFRRQVDADSTSLCSREDIEMSPLAANGSTCSSRTTRWNSEDDVRPEKSPTNSSYYLISAESTDVFDGCKMQRFFSEIRYEELNEVSRVRTTSYLFESRLKPRGSKRKSFSHLPHQESLHSQERYKRKIRNYYKNMIYPDSNEESERRSRIKTFLDKYFKWF